MRERIEPLAAILFLAATVFALIGIFILQARWDVPRGLAAGFFGAALVLALPYLKSW